MPDDFPVLDRPPVDGGRMNERVWLFLGELASRFPGSWVLVGGQMVLLLGMEHGQLPRRETNDVDALVNVRVLPRGTMAFAAALREMGLELEGINADGVGHRFIGQGLAIDVLAPDHLGQRVSLTTVAPARTVQVPGGTRPLDSPKRCPVAVGGKVHLIPRPDLGVAIVGKAAALTLPEPQRHAEDLAFLCGLAPDPRPIDAALTKGDGRLLEGARSLLDDDGVWEHAGSPNQARSTLHYLLRERGSRQL